MNNLMFSVIIPVYRTEKYLTKCVDSILKQTYSNFEVILVDDGSPDMCPQMCDELRMKDPRVKVVHKENGGLSSARNAGLEIAQGDYVMFVDSDDFWIDDGGLEHLAKQLNETKADISIIGMIKYYECGRVVVPYHVLQMQKVYRTEEIEAEQLMLTNAFIACAVDKVVHRNLIESNSLSFVNGQLSEDIEWCCRLLQCNPKIAVYGRALYAYRQDNADSITHNIGRKNLEHICSVIEKYRMVANTGTIANKFLLNFLAEQYVLWLAVSNLVDKNEILDLLQRMKYNWRLIDNHKYPHVNKVFQVRWLGFENVRKLLGLYKKIIK